MLSKIITLFFTMIWSTASFATVVVPVFWPFGVSTLPANHTRTLIQEANQIQSKYKFVFQHKPGAGGGVAPNTVKNYNGPAILAATSSFFIRPNLVTDNSYYFSDFHPMFVMCSSSVGLGSKHIKNINDLKSVERVTVGISGYGSLTHLFALELKKQFPSINIIPYQGFPMAIVDVLGDNLDAAVAFLGDLNSYADAKTITILGITGPKSVNDNLKSFKDQNVVGLEKLVTTYSWVGNIHITETMSNEIFNILTQAEKSLTVQKSYNDDFCVNTTIQQKNLKSWYQTQQYVWDNITKNVKLD
jgi:tripartite-type tricarboxylate transporter receptor subunit TctC